VKLLHLVSGCFVPCCLFWTKFKTFKTETIKPVNKKKVHGFLVPSLMLRIVLSCLFWTKLKTFKPGAIKPVIKRKFRVVWFRV
jgi:hypothetical protein